MSGVDFDSLLTSRPVDLTARVVTTVSEVPRVAFTDTRTFQLCPPLAEVPEQITDLTGRRIGNLLVVGYSHRKPKRKRRHEIHGDGSRWVVRCSCGSYEIRKGCSLIRAFENPKAQDHSNFCSECSYVFKLKNKARKQAVKVKQKDPSAPILLRRTRSPS